MNYKKLITVTLALVVIGWIANETLFKNGIDDLKGGFTEIAKYRNPNNTGPIQRIYVVTVKDTAIAQLMDYGNSKPHSKYGNTKVYYFLSNADVPTEIFPGTINFNPKYNSGCFAVYEKSAMGNFGLTKNPSP